MGTAISVPPTKPGFAKGMLETLPSSDTKKMKAATNWSSRPKRRGIQRACRMPTQNAPAPSSAQANDVHFTSSASGSRA